MSVEEVLEIWVRRLGVDAGVLGDLDETHDVDEVVAFEIGDCVSDVGTKNRIVDLCLVDAVGEGVNDVFGDFEITVGEVTDGFDHFDGVADGDFVGCDVSTEGDVDVGSVHGVCFLCDVF